ncbi:hypothetical protein [Cohnella silvisoli]|uniref:Uncharacterized protein n=1 Tax=Cohnella silvisoli TaxID=2873699 RepID=A0ABV1KTU8_9BACL|nr:hypothetical protein [Cohnella silvisoli]MCD9022745.1 hypothetical protein [Cohnella silvisoli]
MTENNIIDEENQTYDAQVAELAAEKSVEDDDAEIEQNEGYKSDCRE